VRWTAFDVAILRSTWDYSLRLDEFLAWVGRTARQTRLLNPAEVVRWNVDKRYLDELAARDVPTVPSEFIAPGADVALVLNAFVARHAHEELVIKPAVGGGSRDAQRYDRASLPAAIAHAGRLLAAGRTALVQPYLDRVDRTGETALIFFDGRFSHAIRKAALLQRGAAPVRALFAPELITARTPEADEIAVAERALAAVPFEMPLYARVDLLRDAHGEPCVLELELTEPSLFFASEPGSAARFAARIAHRSGTF
jgi:O-ureido-D-serine cyclo-ligase